MGYSQRVTGLLPVTVIPPAGKEFHQPVCQDDSCWYSALCTHDRHWKCAMLPLSVLDYVIVHETDPGKDANHSSGSWRTIETVMPGYEKQKNWLRFNGARMGL